MTAGRYCVFGNPIAHSKSPQIHAAFAQRTGQDISYERRLAPLDGFPAAVRRFIEDGGWGANVTVPFKLEAAALAQVLTPRARAAGAVNTLIFTDAEIVGDNTDGAGLVADILRNARVTISGKRILLLGAGGAARGVVLPLLAEHPAQLVVANRTRATADTLVELFLPLADHGEQLLACGFTEAQGPFDIIVNATSASLGGELPPLSPALFAPHTLALDMMYGAAPTVFMDYATRQGSVVRDGLGMLVEQAAEAFYVWRGVRPDTAEVLARLREAL